MRFFSRVDRVVSNCTTRPLLSFKACSPQVLSFCLAVSLIAALTLGQSVEAADTDVLEPEIVSPAPDSVLGSSATFVWEPNGTPYTTWYLTIGTKANARDIYYSRNLNARAPLEVTASLPGNSQTLHVRLAYRSKNKPWQYKNYEYIAPAADEAAKLITPIAGSRLAPIETFQWDANGAVFDQWSISVGTKPAGRNLYNSGVRTSAAPLEATNKKAFRDGDHPLYVRLAHRVKKQPWIYADYVYQAPKPPVPGDITSPIAGTTLDAINTFVWEANEAQFDQWYITAGASAKKPTGLYSSGIRSSTDPLEVTVTNYLGDDAPVYLRLRYRQKGKSWVTRDYQYQAAKAGTGEITSPAINSVLPSSATFSWNSNGALFDRWFISVGSTSAGSRDLFYSGLQRSKTDLQVTTGALPGNGQPVTVRLGYKYRKYAWVYADYTYQAPNAADVAKITSPEAGSILSGVTTFDWTPNDVEFDSWFISVGDSANSPGNLYNSGIQTASDPYSVTTNELPTDIGLLYVRLGHRYKKDDWLYIDYSYDSTQPLDAQITSPEPDSILQLSNVFSWQPYNSPFDEWTLSVGSSIDNPESIFHSGIKTSADPLQVTVDNLPDNDHAVNVRLAYRLQNEPWTILNVPYKGAGMLTTDALVYAGAFRVPAAQTAQSSLEYAQGVIATSGDSLYIVGHVYEDAIAELGIPELVQSTEISELNMAQVRQPLSQVLNRAATGNPERLDQIVGLEVVDNSLVVNALEYYDAPADNTLTTLVVQNATDLAASSVSAFHSIDGFARAGGWLSPIPQDWTDRIGAQYISGNSSGGPIIGRHSVGPSAFGVDLPAELSGSEFTSIPSTELLGFSLDYPLHADLENSTLENKLWTHLSQASYGFILEGTNTYITIGFSSGHKSGVGYKVRQDDGNLCGGYCAHEAADKSNYYWLWDMNDLMKVKDSQLLPHEVQPYASGELALPFQTDRYLNEIGGASYDSSLGQLYISLLRADNQAEGSTELPIIVVYDIVK